MTELAESLDLFNRRWSRFLNSLDLDDVNQLIDGYNRWYVLEKECVVGSHRVARQGFEPLEPLTSSSLEAIYPLLISL
jgi:hypothetical protein